MLQKIRELTKNLAIYGLGDAAIQVVNFLLLGVYVQYLSKEDYGVLALLGLVEAVTKLFFRWGVDGSFMRFWYDCPDDRSRQRLASTLFFFLLATNGVLLIASVAASPALARWLGAPAYTRALQLVLLNTFAIGFTFIPFHVLRMQQRAREFSLLSFARSSSTLVLRLILVVGLGHGVMGVVVADLAVTAVLLAVMVPWFAPLIRPAFSAAVLRESLAFGLPRVPHGFAQQVIAVGDKFVLSMFVSLAQVGLYSMGVSVGLIQKMFLAAFEYAWAPFYYATVREPGAQRVFSAVTTYGVAVMALMTAGLSAIAADLLELVTHGQYTAAAGVVAWTSIGVFFQGVYLMTSIGLNITKRTQYYPVATAVAAIANIALNVALIPRVGIMGAAYANGVSYAIQAAIAYRYSQQFYPVAYEWSRLIRVVLSAAVAWLAAAALPPMHPLLGILVRGATVVVVMSGALWAGGFLRPEELAILERLRAPKATAPAVVPPAETTEFAGEIVATDLPEVEDGTIAIAEPSSARRNGR
ncbi:MAG TPA: polysaccharide biosynthesis C-terminal domain-containing protein [Vicinamibacterales bacterium]|nr:polysaccharide biosynthesis C-terminal domain-containing protein [Vicinamibacterales bacterium]